jgi:hypothetical protein
MTGARSRGFSLNSSEQSLTITVAELLVGNDSEFAIPLSRPLSLPVRDHHQLR